MASAKKYTKKTKTPKELEAEKMAVATLNSWVYALRGRGALLARKADIKPSVISRMCNGKNPISMEAAMLMELASDGDLKAEALCPARADVIRAFRASK